MIADYTRDLADRKHGLVNIELRGWLIFVNVDVGTSTPAGL
jgi:hypothetical protein